MCFCGGLGGACIQEDKEEAARVKAFLLRCGAACRQDGLQWRARSKGRSEGRTVDHHCTGQWGGSVRGF